jgi:hypothetical protein
VRIYLALVLGFFLRSEVAAQKIRPYSLTAGLKSGFVQLEDGVSAGAYTLVFGYQRNFNEGFTLQTSLNLGSNMPLIEPSTRMDLIEGERYDIYIKDHTYLNKINLQIGPTFSTREQHWSYFMGFNSSLGLVNYNFRRRVETSLLGTLLTTNNYQREEIDSYVGYSLFFGFAFKVGPLKSGQEIHVTFSYDYQLSFEDLLSVELVAQPKLSYYNLGIDYCFNFKKF